MYKPNGHPAKDIDPVMLLNLWAHHLDKDANKPMIFAGIGKPSYGIDNIFARSAATYWQELLITNKAVDYGLPQGCLEARNLMADALTAWYGPDTTIDADDLIFTVGASSALRMLFKILNKKSIITTLPYYCFYNNIEHHNDLHFIQVMKTPEYRLTADLLETSIKGDLEIGAFLFCDPNNPLGTVVGKEWMQIARVLKSCSPDIPIILDEAYAELCLYSKHVSLLQVAPELKERIIVIRSATKGFSASGERIAVVACFNELWREKLIQETIFSYAHAPKSLQQAYAKAMAEFSSDKQKKLAAHYQVQVEYVQSRLKSMQLHLPEHAVEGGFYVIADLKQMMGSPIPHLAKSALGKTGQITSDVDICYSLLFSDQVMISPLSYFGADPSDGRVRITCGGGITQLEDLLNRLEYRLRVLA